MRILVSGFEAFGGGSVNPSALLINELSTGRIAIPPGVVVETVVLPVGFNSAFDVLRASIERFDPDVVLAFGQAGGRGTIDLERIAINVMDADIDDNDGLRPRDQWIHPTGPAAYFSTLPLRTYADALTEAGIAARISNSAGAFVCNFLFYNVQAYFAKAFESGAAERSVRSGFIHLPHSPEQIEDKPEQPSMPLETMARALELILAAT